MSKLKAPLLSLGASGQIGKSLVFFAWKGLDVVREYVIPSNPRTTLQTTHRARMTAAVAAIHTAQGRATNPLDAEDVAAYALLAGVVKAATTWFNQAVKEHVDEAVAGGSPVIFYDGHPTPGASQLTMDIYEHYVGQTNGHFWYGTSKTALVNSQVAIVAGAHIDAVIAGLTTGVKYYIQYRPDVGDPSHGCNSGIYYGYPT